MTARLAGGVEIGGRPAPSRVVFGPHETNLGKGRALSPAHTAYYARRAGGGAGVIITETASVTPDDWPYERAPLAAEAGPGWGEVARVCAPFETVVLAGLGHAGGQGSSAYSQEVMWAPSRVADVVSREPPAELDGPGIRRVVAGFGRAAAQAMESGLAGVEVDAGAWSLLRQFHSGLTNQRSDQYGQDRLALTVEVLEAVRRALGPDGILALRLSCDELAPWAGVTPDMAVEAVDRLAGLDVRLDLLTVVRVGPYSTAAYRPDAHHEAGFNRELCARMREAAGGRVPVVLQGSLVDPVAAQSAIDDNVCDLVEMTRALIADADLVAKVARGQAEGVRPCLRCNQACQVRDNRNPVVSCVMDPASGHELTSVAVRAGAFAGRALVVGGGPAGLECARVLAEGGATVRLLEASDRLGGVLRRAAVGAGRVTLEAAVDWLESEVRSLGVEVGLSHPVDAPSVEAARSEGWSVILATGSRPFPRRYPDAGVPVVGPLEVLEGDLSDGSLPPGPLAVIDMVGDWVAVNLAEWVATTTDREVTLISPDPVAGTLLSRTGDLAEANARLQRAGVRRQLRSLVQSIDAPGPDCVTVEDAWTGQPYTVPAAVVVDCGHRLPEESLYLELGDPTIQRAGDCVAPRSLLEAVLEGRRAARAVLSGAPMAVHQ